MARASTPATETPAAPATPDTQRYCLDCTNYQNGACEILAFLVMVHGPEIDTDGCGHHVVQSPPSSTPSSNAGGDAGEGANP